jgi:Skp family chaperone for outer membrane proteins
MMAEIEKWIEEIKNLTLYEQRNVSNLPLLLLEQTETNSRYNEKMARLRASIENVHNSFPEGYRQEFEGFFDRVVTIYRSVDGWAVAQAIEAEKVRVEKELAMKKTGIMGMFGGGNK